MSVFAVALLVPLALVGALILGLRMGRDDVGRDVTNNANQPDAQGSAAADGQSAARKPRLVRIGTFDQPLYVTSPPGDRRRVFVVEQPGRVRVVVGGRVVRRPFLDISGRVVSGGEQGLLSLAFAPDYRTSGRFYVDFTDRNGDTRIVEFQRSKSDPSRADASSGRQVLFQSQPYANHNGGLLLFGPDGHMYVGFGDGGSEGDPQNRAQNLDTLLGKILRIDPRPGGGYTSPASNPFGGRSGRKEIYSYGLRNPWRFSFDRSTGALYIGDVGDSSREEIDYRPRGQASGVNFGWSCFEGKRPFDSSRNCPGARGPVLDYSHSNGECSVTGGVVIRDPAMGGLRGRYLYGDFCRGQVRTFRISGGRATGDRPLGVRTVSSLSSFGEDASGRVYLTSLEGPVYRLSR